MAKPLRWVGSSYRALVAMPKAVQRVFGYALSQVEDGATPASAKPFTHGGIAVMELVEDFDRNTYRAVYTAKLRDAVYVLHCFQKKSKSGIATPKPDVELIAQRFRMAQELSRGKSMSKKERIEVIESSGNVYADLGFRDAEAMKVKAGLVMKIDLILKQRQLTQSRAAEVTGIPQPRLSAILRGHFHNVSERKLLQCLTALGQDVKIVVTPARRGREGTLTVAA